MRACPLLRVLVTSRSALHISGEHCITVPPLQLQQIRPSNADRVRESEARRLFVERAQAVQPDFQLMDDNAAAVVEICGRLEGLPFALELAAARARVLSVHALLNRLERRLPTLIGGDRDLPARQQTLRSTLAWSYDLLSPEEKTLFRRVAVFSGGFELDGAEAVCDADGSLRRRTPELIEALLANSLLLSTRDEIEPRLGMLETVRIGA